MVNFAIAHLSIMDSKIVFRYTRVKYNDLVSQDINIRGNVIKSLFDFIGIPYSNEVARNVDIFRLGRNSTEGKKQQSDGYFGVYRPNDYNPDHWEEEIDQQVRESCAGKFDAGRSNKCNFHCRS